ncbi:MAG: type II toxin-antitoxin system VapC family toxin [Leptolyngbyaceae cyanobacterium RM2_2_4]|nr:type II toxin-antitoxin system VapC family toxin [bacterium]NJO53247.1 type II toxin-antitoxin system VapC family toxin [Leptolyngbyaceae cyanobacterium RM2_2_4]
MYVLDTDHLSLIQRNSPEGSKILARLATVESDSVAVTVVTYEEQLRGRLNSLSRAKTPDKRIIAYRWLQKLAENYCSIQILAFDQAASLEYERLRKMYRSLGTMDLRIAAISIVQNAVLLTKNTSDFGKIKGLSWV